MTNAERGNAWPSTSDPKVGRPGQTWTLKSAMNTVNTGGPSVVYVAVNNRSGWGQKLTSFLFANFVHAGIFLPAFLKSFML